MGKKSDPPPPPDYSQVAAASKEAAELNYKLGQEQLAWAKETYASDRGLSDTIVDQFLETEEANSTAAAKDRARYETIYQPLEDDLAKDAASYASPGRKDIEIGRATATVAQSFEAARHNATRALESFGIDPSSTRYQALDIGVRTQQAAASAAAANQADMMVDATGRALRSEAINVGRGYPGQVAGTYNTALQSGTGAVNSQLATTASGVSSMGNPNSYFNSGNQAIGTWGNVLDSQHKNSIAAYKAQGEQSSGIGQVAGMVGGMAMKKFGFFEDGGAVDDVNGTPGSAGGQVPVEASPSGGQATDDVSARLNVGEFVMPKEAVSWHGEKFFQKLIEKAAEEKSKAGAKPQVAIGTPRPATFQTRPATALPAR